MFFFFLLFVEEAQTWRPFDLRLQNNGLSRYTSTCVFLFHNSVIEVCVLTAPNKSSVLLGQQIKRILKCNPDSH